MIEIGTRVEMDSDGETYAGVVVGSRSHRVTRASRGSGAGQGDRNGLNSGFVTVWSVLWDGVDEPGEYRDGEFRPVVVK